MTKSMSAPFVGDFEFLPLLSHIEFGPVSSSPTSDDFQLSAARACAADPFTMYGAAATWHMEATRERRHAPGCTLAQKRLSQIVNRAAVMLAQYQRAWLSVM